ncbi:MAG: hypothetical protein JW873_06460 [Candidatus Saganbacteria bacterium]|nr:hypothetical protein [Candidatus Saganbacteria bacterium]
MSLQISAPYLLVSAAPAGNVNKGSRCDSPGETKKEKIDTIADKALQKLSAGKSGSEVADYVRKRSIVCFSVTAQSVRQDDILDQMKEKLAANPKKYPGVTQRNIGEVASNLGRKKAEKAAPRDFTKGAIETKIPLPLYMQNAAGEIKKLSEEAPALVAIEGNAAACNIFVLAPGFRDKKDDVETPQFIDVLPIRLSEEAAAPYLKALDVKPEQCGEGSTLHISLAVIPVPAEPKPAPPPAPSPAAGIPNI